MNGKMRIIPVPFLLIVLSLIVLLNSRSASWKNAQLDEVSLAFRGVTTNSLGGSLASFRLHNGHRKPIKYVLAPPQVQREGQWPVQLPSMGNATEVVVRPGQDVGFSTSVPSKTEPWRVPVAYVWAPSLYRRSLDWFSLHVLRRRHLG